MKVILDKKIFLCANISISRITAKYAFGIGIFSGGSNMGLFYISHDTSGDRIILSFAFFFPPRDNKDFLENYHFKIIGFDINYYKKNILIEGSNDKNMIDNDIDIVIISAKECSCKEDVSSKYQIIKTH